MNEKEYAILTMGILIGLILGITLLVILPLGHNIDHFKIYEREGEPSVMRLYEWGADSIYVQDRDGDYSLTLIGHLRTIQGKAEKAKEEVEIKTLVGWYE